MSGSTPSATIRTVVIIGTRHDYQRPGSPGSAQFHAFVATTCGERAIGAIGEEMSLDALRRFGASESVCKVVANSLGIPHRYCDPSIAEQLALGIEEPGRVHISAFSPCPDPDDVDPEVKRADAIRRGVWLQRVLQMNTWPLLFVCGSQHTQPFPALLQANGITVEVAVRKWAPA